MPSLIETPFDAPSLLVPIRVLLFWIFAVAISHKMRHFTLFVQQVADYRVLPLTLNPWVAIAIILAELALVSLLSLLNQPRLGALLAAALLCLYACAMLINLLRGRRNIDCGCGDKGQGQVIGWALVVRNVLLATTALALASYPSIHAIDSLWMAVLLLLSSGTLILLYTAVNQLMVNQPHLKAHSST